MLDPRLVLLPDLLFLLLHLGEVLGFELLKGVYCCRLVFLHVGVPGAIKLQQLVLLETGHALHFQLLLLEEVLFLALYFFLLDFQGLGLGLVCLAVLACCLAAFAVVVQQLQEFDNPVVNKPPEINSQLLLLAVVDLDFPQHSQELVEAQVALVREDHP